MSRTRRAAALAPALLVAAALASAQDVRIVRPVETDEVLVNRGMGFMSFQRFNGDALNEGGSPCEQDAIVQRFQQLLATLATGRDPRRVRWALIFPSLAASLNATSTMFSAFLSSTCRTKTWTQCCII